MNVKTSLRVYIAGSWEDSSTVRVLRWSFLGGVVILLLGSVSLFYVGFVKVKMLPFDNKSEFQVIIDMPNGTTLEANSSCYAVAGRGDAETARGGECPDLCGDGIAIQLQRPGASLLSAPRSECRGYPGEHIAQRRAKPAKPRNRQAGANAARTYRRNDTAARIKVAEVPPGPPVLQTLVAEVYGPSLEGRIALARRVRDLFKQTNGIVDVDWYVEDDQPIYRMVVDQEKAALNGISNDDIARAMQVASAGYVAGLLHQEAEKEDVPLKVRLDRSARSDIDRIQTIKVAGRNDRLVALSELVSIENLKEDKSIYHKNLMPVTYVTADIAGVMESPVYAVLQLGPEIDKFKIPAGYKVEQHMAAIPSDPDRYSMKWDGEWHITYEVFRDLGIAFAAVLILIYGLVVGWFQSFLTPLIIMAAIPFSLVGILPAHGLLNAFFTATSMIGFIAGAGIVVRNSIILVDFIELRLQEGMPLDQAVIDAGAVRFRPMMLTAAAVVVGSSVILFDPIFQGLAIALMAGEIASLLLSRMTVPVLFYVFNQKRRIV